ncbi:hypothetical protein BKI52_22880 [marine bacterium AO1-C]|nr:hypothetical protein BKI52_22880 [marine bacterium AO1-C]
MEILHNSKFYHIRYEKEHELFHYYHPPETLDMTAGQYLQELEIFIKHALKHKPKVVLGDMRDFNFIITPYIQEWIDEHLFTAMEAIGLQKNAILLTPQFIIQLSVKQAIEENPNATIKTRYFDNERAAREWLLA